MEGGGGGGEAGGKRRRHAQSPSLKLISALRARSPKDTLTLLPLFPPPPPVPLGATEQGVQSSTFETLRDPDFKIQDRDLKKIGAFEMHNHLKTRLQD